MKLEEVYQYIDVNPAKGRKSVFLGTKITPEHINDDVSKGMSVEEILKQHPQLTAKHLEAAAAYRKLFPTDSERILWIFAWLCSPF